MAAAVALRSDSKRKYSWWWDSHISPKNSKWLQENLTDMDSKVKQMIKLIEEDADSFARRAEMYYKKRPELMKMVEEFYRAYRALAERYDHATGVIRQAHRTMSEAFPNQVHFMMGDDMPAGPADGEPRTPDMPSTRALFYPEELPKDALGMSPLPQAIERNGARNGINFHDAEEEDQNLLDKSDSKQMGKAEMEILTLKNALAKLEAEKEAGRLQYQESLERLANLESEVSRAKEDAQEFNERASKAEAEVQTLKEALTKLEAERESGFLQYQQCLEKIAKLEYIISHAEKDTGKLTEGAGKAEAEAQSLKQELAKLETEKGDALLQYKHCLEKISALENKLLHAEDNVVAFKERADTAEREVEILTQALTKLTEEQEASVVQYQQCLDTISFLEHKLASAQEEAQRLNSEIDNGTVKLKGAEEKCLLLEESNHNMHSVLETQLHIATDTLEKLKEKNNFLESSLLDANSEIEGLKKKSKKLQDTYTLLENEKAEKGNLVYELDYTKKRLAEMENERQSSLHAIEELRAHLDAQKQEYVCLVQLSKSQLASMETKICLLQKEGQRIRKECEEEQLNKDFSAQTEIFVLQQCVQDLEENNFSVLLEFQKLLEASQLSEKLISELEQENLEQQIEVKSLYDQIKVLRMGLYRVLKTLEVDSNQWYQGKGGQDQMLLNLTLVKLQAFQKMVSEIQDEKQQLLIENSIFVTLLGQLQREVKNLVSAKNSLNQELACRYEQYLVLQTNNRKHSEMNEVLSLKIMEGDKKEEVLKAELKNLQGELLELRSDSRKLSEMNEVLSLKIKEGDHKEEVLKLELKNLQVELLHLQGDYKTLQEESRKMLQEEKTLKNFISELGEEKSNLEEESCAIFAERMSLGILSLLLRDAVSGKFLDIEDLSKNHDKLLSVNDDLNVKVKLMEEKLMEFSVIQNEKSELHKTVGHLKSKCDEVERKGAEQEKQIMKLSSDYDEQRKVLNCIREANLKLESELQLLNEELVEAKSKELILSSEIQEGREDIKHWESQAAALFGDLLIYVVHQALFEGKIHELIEECKSFEGRNCSKDLEVEQLKERIGSLESENEELKTQMMSSIPEFISLSDSITSLENHTLSHESFHEVDKEAKDQDVILARHAESFQKVSKEQLFVGTIGNLDLQTMQMRIRAIEEAVMERERALILEISNANSKLGAAIGQLDELKSRKSMHQEPVVGSKQESRNLEGKELGHGKSKSVNEVMTKDIVLDQISGCSSYGINQRETFEGDDQMLEIWETTEQDSTIDLTVGKGHKLTTTPTEKKHRAHPYRESMLEKDVSVDKLEISRSLSGSKQEVKERKILERLDSDAQKLTNLQITVQDLKRKVEITENNKKGDEFDYSNVKEQLEESEETITKLSDVNRRLMKSIQDESFSSEEKSDEIGGSERRRKISEQARRGSEKIGRLQMEVHKLQFCLLKIDDDNKTRGKAKIIERKTKVLLRDYLYGGTRTGQKQKRRHLCACACVQPPTKGD